MCGNDSREKIKRNDPFLAIIVTINIAPGNASDLPDPFTDFLPDDNAKRSNSKQYRQGMNARAASGFRQAC